MPIDFPTPTFIGQEFTASGKTWKWNGYAWDSITLTPVGATGSLIGLEHFQTILTL